MMNDTLTATPPPPGSPEAVARGCACPVIDNQHGRGYLGRTGVFWITVDCLLHGPDMDAAED